MSKRRKILFYGFGKKTRFCGFGGQVQLYILRKISMLRFWLENMSAFGGKTRICGFGQKKLNFMAIAGKHNFAVLAENSIL